VISWLFRRTQSAVGCGPWIDLPFISVRDYKGWTINVHGIKSCGSGEIVYSWDAYGTHGNKKSTDNLSCFEFSRHHTDRANAKEIAIAACDGFLATIGEASAGKYAGKTHKVIESEIVPWHYPHGSAEAWHKIQQNKETPQ